MQVQLFNLENDVAEQSNVAPKHPDIVARLESKMKEAWQEPVTVP